MPDQISRRQVLVGGLTLAGAAAVPQAFAWPAHAAARAGEPAVVPLVEPEELPWAAARQIVAETQLPVIPSGTFNVMSFGARNDGGGDNTVAFRRAIQAAVDAGGGTVLIPSGTYVTGAIHLRSKVNLRLDGATLRFSGTAGNFPTVLTRYEGIECMNRSPMIYAHRQSDIAITGRGTLDAIDTRPWNRGSDRGYLEDLVADGVPPQQRTVPGNANMRSTFIEPYDCDRVLIQGITLRNSQFWQIHPTLCRHVTVDGVTTDANTSFNNTDGVDPESCDHVVIRNCDLGAHDDNVAIKSGRDADGRRVNVPSQNIVVFGCRMNGNWGAITCGSEQTGGIRNVYAYKCTLVGATKFALYVKSNTRRGGFSENINLDSFTGVLDRSVIFLTSTYNNQTGSFPPRFGPINISNSSCTRAGRKALDVSGLSNSHVRGLSLTNCDFRGVADTSNTLNFVDNLSISNVQINGRALPDTNPQPPAGDRYEAEDATFDGTLETQHAGFSGRGAVNTPNAAGAFVEWAAVTSTAARTATLRFRFANGVTTDRPMDLSVNGTVVGRLAFAGTGAWTTWQVATVNAPLNAGSNTVRLVATTAGGGPNVDWLEVPR